MLAHGSEAHNARAKRLRELGALKILHSESLPLYREMLALLDAMPQLDIPRLHKLADQIAKKADAESFEVLTSLLIERLRAAAHAEALSHIEHVRVIGRLYIGARHEPIDA